MVAVVSGLGLGLQTTSRFTHGAGGTAGDPQLGRGNENVYVNATTGNLVIQSVDETITGLGPDFVLSRTYNSQGTTDGNNDDQWSLGMHRRVYGLVGGFNATGSTVKKVFGDGAEVTYTYNASLGVYVSGEGDGAHDTLTWNSGNVTWTWTDGSTRTTEVYEQVGAEFRLRRVRDVDLNEIVYSYNANGQLSTVTLAGSTSQVITFIWSSTASNANLLEVRVSSGGQNHLRTVYGYDGSNRLTTVTTDLSSEDQSTANGDSYVTTYAYDGATKRILSITQRSGVSSNVVQSLTFSYVLVNGTYRIRGYMDGEGRVTTYNYSDYANPGGNSTPTPTPGWSSPQRLDGGNGGGPAKIAFDAAGNGFAVYGADFEQTGSYRDVIVRRYDRATNSWGPEVVLDAGGASGGGRAYSLSVDDYGNAIVAWGQHDGTTYSMYASRFNTTTNSWIGPALLETSAQPVEWYNMPNVATSIRGSNVAAVSWVQYDGTSNSTYVSIWNGTTWSTATAVDAGTNNTQHVSIAIDAAGSATAMWVQSDGTADSIYYNRFNGTSWSGATTLETGSAATSRVQIAFDWAGNGIAIWLQGTDLVARRYTKATNNWAPAFTVDNLATTAEVPSLAVDENTGAGLVAWVQNDGTTTSVYARRFTGMGTGTDLVWSGVELLENNSRAVSPNYQQQLGNPVASMRGNQAVVYWAHAQPLGVTGDNNTDLTVARFNGASWSAPEIVSHVALRYGGYFTAAAVDAQGNVNVLWNISGGGVQFARYSAPGAWTAAQSLSSPTNESYFGKTATDANGNVITIWRSDQTGYIFARRLDKATNTWSNPVALSAPGVTGGAFMTALSVDEFGNAVAVWQQQNDGAVLSLNASRYDVATNTWGPTALLENLPQPVDKWQPGGFAVSVRGANAAVSWLQKNGTIYDVYCARYTGGTTGSWVAAAPMEGAAGQATATSVSVDMSGNVTVGWIQNDGAVDSAWFNRFTPSNGLWSGATTLESTSGAASGIQVGFDAAGNGFALWAQDQNVYVRRFDRTTGWAASNTTLDTNGNNILYPSLSVDGLGNAVAAWIQSDGTADSVFAARFTGGAWGPAMQIDASNVPVRINPGTAAVCLSTSVHGDNAAVTWLQKTAAGDPDPVSTEAWVARSNGLGWGTEMVSFTPGEGVFDPNVAIDNQGNTTVSWAKYMERSQVYVRRYNVFTPNSGAATFGPPGVAGGVLRTAFNSAGNGIAVWASTSGSTNTVYASRFDKASNRWLAASVLDTGPSSPSGGWYVKAGIDDSGNAIVAWNRHDGSTYSMYASRYVARTATWSTRASLESSSQPVATANITDFGVHVSSEDSAAVAWLQNNPANGTNDVYVARWAATGWMPAAVVDSNNNTASNVSVATDLNGNATALWQQSDGTAASIFAARFTATVPAGGSWAPASAIDAGGTTVSSRPELAFDAFGNGFAAWIHGNDVYARKFDGATGTWGVTYIVSPGTVPPEFPSLAVDNQGNAVLAWIRNDGTAKSVYAARFTAGASAWSSVSLLENSSRIVASPYSGGMGNPIAAISNGRAVVSWAQQGTWSSTEFGTNIFQSRWDGAVWTAAEQLDNTTENNGGFFPTVAIDGEGNITNAWSQWVGSTSDNFGSRRLASTSYSETRVGDGFGQVTIYRHDAAGRLRAVISPPGTNGERSETRYEYDADGNIITIIEDAQGTPRYTSMTYDTRGNMVYMRDAAGNAVRRTYDGSNQLLSETVYSAPDMPHNATPYVNAMGLVPKTTRYVYDGENHLRFVISAEGRVTEHQYREPGDGALLRTFVYTATSYTSLTSTLTELTNWRGVAANIANVQRTDYAYDGRGNLLTETRWASTDSAGAGTGTSSVTTYSYDMRGMLLSKTTPRGTATGANDYFTTFEYDSMNRLERTTEWLSTGETRVSTMTYDDANNRVVTTSASGLITTSVFDRSGRLVSVSKSVGATAHGTTSYAYDAGGRLVMVTGPSGDATSSGASPDAVRMFYVYDNLGRKSGEVDGDGTLTIFLYDATHRVYKTEVFSTAVPQAMLTTLQNSANGASAAIARKQISIAIAGVAGYDPAKEQGTRSIYDRAGRLMYSLTKIAGTGANETYAVTRYVYNDNAQVTDVIEYANPVTIARSVDVIDPAAFALTLPPDTTNDRRSRNFYDRDGLLVATLDAEGYLTEHTYDSAGRLKKTYRYANQTAAGVREYFSPGAIRPSADNSAYAQGDDPEMDIVSRCYYDGQGRKVGELDGEGYFTEYVYDVDGNLIRESRYDKQLTASDTTTFTDLRNLVVGLSGLGVVARTTSFEYDGARRLTKTTEVTGTAWSDPVTSGSINGGTSLPFLAFDSAGNGFVMSTTNVVNGWPTDVMVRRYDAATQTWGSLQVLDSGTGNVRVASISMDDAGNALVAWSQDDGNGTFSVYAARYTISNGQWSAAASLESSTQQVDYHYQPKFATSIAAANAAAVSWIQYDGTKYSTYVSRWNGSTWTATRVDNTTTTTSATSEVSVAIDTSGRVNAVWTETNTANSNVEIRYARYSGSAWSTATTLDTAATSRSKPSVTLDSSGNGFATWVQNGQLLARRFTAASGWGATSTVSTVTNTNAVQRPSLAMSSNGQAVVAWMQGDPADQNVLSAYAARWNGSSWSAATQIDDSSYPTTQWQQDSRVVYVAMRGNHAAVGFSQAQAGGSLPYGTTDIRVSRWNGTGWDAPETVDQMERGMSSYFGAVGIDGQGKTYAGWTNINWGPGVRISSTEPGDVTIFTYDQADNVTRTERAAGTPDARAVEARYDALGRVTRELSAAGRALITGSTPQAEIDRIWIDYGISYAYDNAGRRLSATRRLEGTSTLLTSYFYYDFDGRLLFEVDPSGYVKENIYNALGQLTTTIDHVVPLSAADRASLRGGLITTAATTTLQGTQNAALDGRVTYTYSTRGDLATTTTAEGALTSNQYTNFGELRTVTTKFDATRSPVTRYVYDRRGLLKEVYGDDGGLNQLQTQTYDAFGRVRSAMKNGATTQFEYDRLGREIATVDPLSARRTTTYDGFSRVLKTIDALGAVTTYAYNNATRRTTILTPEGVAVANEYNRHGQIVRVTSRTDTTTYEYNADGNLKKVSDSLGTIEQHSYDSLGREFETRDGNNNLTRFSYDASSRLFTRTVDPGGLNLVTQFGYSSDATSRYIDTTEPGGMVTRTRYDRDGQVSSVTSGYGTADQSTTTYAYDNAGHQILVTEGSNGAAPRRTRYAFDKLGRLQTKTVDPTDLGGAQALNIVSDYKYDARGNLSRVIEASNKPEARSTWYTYDAANRLSQTIDALGAVTELTYDAENRIVASRRYFNTLIPGSLGEAPAKQSVKAAPNDRISRTVYDRDGRVEIQIDEAGAVTRYQYDASGHVSQTTQYASVPSNAAMRVYFVPATNSSASRYLGSFNAGDVVTATVRFKAPPDTSAAMFLGDAGGPDPYDNSEYTLVYGNDGWLTITLSHTMSHADEMYIYVYGDRDGAYANATHSVVYDDARVVSVQRGTVLDDRFDGTVGSWSISGAADAVSLTLAEYGDDATIRSVVNGLANPAQDRVTRNLHDVRGRLEMEIDGSGAVTRYQYDNNGNVTQKTELANTVPVDGAMRLWFVPTTNSSASRFLGNFDTGDVITATVRFKAPADTSARVFLGDSTGPNPYDNYTYTPVTYGNDGWQTLTISWTMTHADEMSLYLYGDRDGAYANATHSVAYDDLKVVSAQRGTILEDRFDGTVPLWAVSGSAQAVQSDVGNEAAIRSLVNSLASPTQDRVTQFWYDAANRVRFALDGEKTLKETQYDNTFRRETNITFGTLATTLNGSMTLAQVYDDVYVTTPLVDAAKDSKTTTQYDFIGRVASVTRRAGNFDVTESYGYDALGNKTSYTNARSSVWNYVYYANGLLKEEVSPSVAVSVISASSTDLSDGAPRTGRIVTRMTYDAFGNVKSRQEGILRLADNSEQTDLSRTTSYDYDLVGRQTTTTYPTLMVYSYPTNDENRTDNTTMLQETSATPTSTVTYNSFGDAVLNLDIGQQYSHKAYDNLGRVRFEVDALRNVTEYTYDAFGNRKTTTRYAAALNPAAVTGSPALSDSAVWSLADIELRRPTLTDSRKITMEYDRENRQTSVTEPETYVYTTNISGTPGSPTTSAAGVTKYSYNAFGQLTLQRRLLDPTTQTFAETYFFYDRAERLITQIDPEGYVTKTYYDARDNVTRKLEYFSRLTSGASTADANVTPPAPPAGDFDRDIRYTYDLLDRLKTQAVQNVEYSSIAEPSGAVTMNQGVQNTTFEYDVVGNRTTVTDHYGRSTFTYYDVLGRITAVAETARDSDDSAATPDVIPLTEMYRDIYGNMVKEIRYSGGASTASALAYAYAATPANMPNQISRQLLDKYGHIIRSQDSFGGNRYASYDRRGNVAKEWQPIVNADGIEEMAVTIHKYDALGREIAIIEPQRRGDAAPAPTLYSIGSRSQYRVEGGNYAFWYGNNTVVASWQDLLSSGTFRVEIRYWRAQPYSGNQASEDIKWFTVSNIQLGGQFTWTDDQLPDGTPPVDGSIHSIRWVRVYAQAANGQYTVLVRDSAGTAPPQPVVFTQMIYTKTRYNAFGEIIGKGVNMNVAPEYENYQEFFDYDAAGRVIRTNADDGVTKVFLYDVAGRVTAEIRSKQQDLRAMSLSTVQSQAFGLAEGQQIRTEKVYNKIDQIVMQRLPRYGIGDITDPVATSITAGVVTGPNFTRAFHRRVQAPASGPPQYYYVIDPLVTGVDGGWYRGESGNYNQQPGFAMVSKARLYWSGTWDFGVVMSFRYRVAGGTWTPLTVYPISTTQLAVDIAGIANNTYEYEISYRRTTESQNSAFSRGTFTINGSSLSATIDQPVSSYVRPDVSQTQDRWGNVTSYTGTNDKTTSYRYSVLGNLVKTTMPIVAVVDTRTSADPNYTPQNQAPFTYNYYDALGRAIGARDANGNLTYVKLNNGGQIVRERFANGTRKDYEYDALGNQVKVTNELGWRTYMYYNSANLLKQVQREYLTNQYITVDYEYDKALRRISETSGEFKADGVTPEKTRYYYDLNGNVQRRRSSLGFDTTYEYDGDGHKIRERNGIGQEMTWTVDHFGRITGHMDLGGAVTVYDYSNNYAGLLGRQYMTTSSYSLPTQNIYFYYDDAGNMTLIDDLAVNRRTIFAYDEFGRRSRERTVVEGRNHQSTIIGYDELDRIKSLSDLRYTLTYEYDAQGNRTHTTVTYKNHTQATVTDNLWYKYDEMNRVRLSQGIKLANGTLDINDKQGIIVHYDNAGQRDWIDTYGGAKLQYYEWEEIVYDPYDPQGYYTIWHSQWQSAFGRYTETYNYDGAGRLIDTSRTTEYRSVDQYGNINQYDTGIQLANKKGWDKASRLIREQTYLLNNNVVRSDYDDDGRMVTQTTRSSGLDTGWRSEEIVNTYDAANNLNYYTIKAWRPGANNTEIARYTSQLNNTYYFADAPLLFGQTVTTTGPELPPGATSASGRLIRGYNANRELISVTDPNLASSNRFFVNNWQGQQLTVIQGNFNSATQAGAFAQALAGDATTIKAQHFFFAGGQHIGSFGQLKDSSGQFKANFDVNFTPVSERFPSAQPLEVVTQQGDTLRIIAGRVYGDSSLWYLIAEENGYSDPDAPLPQGIILHVPSNLVSVANNSNSFRPFNPADAIGDKSPTQIAHFPPPPVKKGCGVLGMLIIIIVVIVVTVVSYGTLTTPAVEGGIGMSSIAAGAIAGAAGSVAGQLVGMALGMQKGFDWKAVALAAIGGAVGAGIGDALKGVGAIKKIAEAAPYLYAGIEAAASSIVTQGIAVAVGLQDKFNWNAVALAAVTAPAVKAAGDFVGSRIDGVSMKTFGSGKYELGSFEYATNQSFNASARASFYGNLAGNTASVAVRAAAGGKFDVAQAAVDIFGNMFGNALAGALLPPVLASQAESAVRRNGSAGPVQPGADGAQHELAHNVSGPTGSAVGSSSSTEGPLEEIVVTGIRGKDAPGVASAIADNTIYGLNTGTVDRKNDVNRPSIYRPGSGETSHPMAVQDVTEGVEYYYPNGTLLRRKDGTSQFTPGLPATNLKFDEGIFDYLTGRRKSLVESGVLGSDYVAEEVAAIDAYGRKVWGAIRAGDGDTIDAVRASEAGAYLKGSEGARNRLNAIFGYFDPTFRGLPDTPDQQLASFIMNSAALTAAMITGGASATYLSAQGFGFMYTAAASGVAADATYQLVERGYHEAFGERYGRAEVSFLELGLSAPAGVAFGWLGMKIQNNIALGPMRTRPSGLDPMDAFPRDRLVAEEINALRQIGANARNATPAANMRLAYQQSRGQIDFNHIEADVALTASGDLKHAMGGHFSTSPNVEMVGTRMVFANGVIRSQVQLRGPDGNWYLKSNSPGSISTLTPQSWPLSRAKAEMSMAFMARTHVKGNVWQGTSSGVNFRFFEPTSPKVPLWRGYPLHY